MLAMGIYQQDDTLGYDISACELTADVSYTVLGVHELKTNLLAGYDWTFDAAYAQNYEHGDTTNSATFYVGQDEWGADQCVKWGGTVSKQNNFNGSSNCRNMQEPVFLNSVPYVICSNTAGTWSSIWKLDAGGSHTMVHEVNDLIVDVASFENHGFIYTLDGENGYYILQLNYNSFDTQESIQVYENTVMWRLY